MRVHTWAGGIVVAGLVAGVIATLVQVVLWVAFTDAFPAVLWRDAHLAAALVAGPSVLESQATRDLRVVLLAGVVHFTLSIAFAASLALFVRHRPTLQALVLGSAFGAALYAVNLHVATYVFPWFDVARGPITLAAHVAFGATAAFALNAHPPRTPI